MRILFASAPGYGLMLPIVPLVWAARAAGHEILVATTAYMTKVGPGWGLPIADVFPHRDVGGDLMLASSGQAPEPGTPEYDDPRLPEGYWDLARQVKPFELFTLVSTEGTIAAGRDFGADLIVYTTDHQAGRMAAVALGIPALEVGNRVSWSTRDPEFNEATDHNDRTGVIPDDSPVVLGLRERLGIGDREPELIARVDPRAPSMGGLTADEAGPGDGVPWWPMRYVPFNGGVTLPEWALVTPERPRICLTLGTVVPLLSDGGTLGSLLRWLGELDVEVVLADHSTDLSKLGPLPDNVRVAGFLPLSTFLDTCSLVIHHGGSGTAAAALHYAVPQLVLPGGSDNPLIARKVVDRKVGLSLDPAEADAPRLCELVGRLLAERSFADAAAEVSAEMATQPSPAQVLDRAVRSVHPTS
ncbi:glycosyltransferase [Streptomyces sp. NPDC050145]|uniref:glycosyltransferase n=1 Tax=Streptomyces sp. NPDC050145 TaxID=3365602 RepID=UPI00379B1068